MYTSTEPCEMCATVIHYAGLNRVVYSRLRRGTCRCTGGSKRNFL
ncbi:hypothetical protein [Saliphagus infecundisoli]|uniref:CMP/dCMP-type deaminase domain-containing protein n=1 Tax=Saliphagus infecundisoli TaxID=1849069 RepID=A0ABD5QEE3_9EURY|nr:hypothetical protein [Saliphagus infecundisoli]